MTSENITPGAKNVPLGHIENEKPTFEVPGEGELLDVDDDTTVAALNEVGTAARQPDDHPYSPDDDPDSDYTARERRDSQQATTPTPDGMRYQPDYPAGASAPEVKPGKASATLDPTLPGAAPRAGG